MDKIPGRMTIDRYTTGGFSIRVELFSEDARCAFGHEDYVFTNAADMLKGLQAIVEPDKGSPEKTGPGPYDPDHQMTERERWAPKAAPDGWLSGKARDHQPHHAIKASDIAGKSPAQDALKDCRALDDLNTHLYGSSEPDDGWRVWEGSLEGQRPAGVEADTMVEYKLRRGGAISTEPARKLVWRHTGDISDIVAYRVVKP